MQKAEFCTVDLYYNLLITFTPNGWKQAHLTQDRGKGDSNDSDSTARMVAQLGLDGWQLVGGASASGRGAQSVLFFQRIIP